MTFADWRGLGILPLQDTEEGVPSSIRRQIVGGRVVSIPEPSGTANPDDAMLVYAENSLGDIHPWMNWSSANPDARTGSWAQAFAAINEKAGASSPGPVTGGAYPPQLQPIGSNAYRADLRYAGRTSLEPKGLPHAVRGSLAIVLPTTDERYPGTVSMATDPRLWCPAAQGPQDCGTTVVDLQPEYEACMDGTSRPGVGGRQALLQSMMKVVPIRDNASGPTSDLLRGPLSAGNGLAWNMAPAMRGGMVGFGLAWGFVDLARGSGGGPTTGGPAQPTTPTTPTTTPITPGGSTGPATPNIPDPGNDDPGNEDPGGDFAGSKKPIEFGQFAPLYDNRYGSAVFASGAGAQLAYGPLHIGAAEDQHQLGVDRDGHPINAGHISTSAFFYSKKDRDCPLLFEGKYPNPGPLPLQSRVHLTYDEDLRHPFADGLPRMGYWRWWAEVPIVPPSDIPTVFPPLDPPPLPPPVRGPTTGGPPGPSPPGPAAPGPVPTPRFPGPGPPMSGQVAGPTSPGPSGPRGRGPTTPNPGSVTGPRFPGYPTTGWRGTPPINPGPSGPYTGPYPPYPDPDPPEPSGPITPSTPTGPAAAPPSGPAEWWVRDQRSRGLMPPAEPVRGSENSEDPHREDAPGSVHRIGQSSKSDVAHYSIMHPFSEGWAAMVFRPQLWVKDYPNIEHNPDLPGRFYKTDELYRPQVMAARAWGAQANGVYDYDQTPAESRARGGTANGGLLFGPPEFEMEDYLGINSTADVTAATTESLLTVAPGAAFALGTPVLDGGLAANGIKISQATGANGSLQVVQLNSSRVAKDLITGQVDQSTGEVIVSLAMGGSQAIQIPRGNDAARPASPGIGYIRINSQGNNDLLEFWNDQGGAWVQLGTP